VVGRPITRAENPEAAARAILGEMQSGIGIGSAQSFS
jgi:orotidine-5'-phosphate decarboxylase